MFIHVVVCFFFPFSVFLSVCKSKNVKRILHFLCFIFGNPPSFSLI